MRMIHCWSCKEPLVKNDQKPKPQSWHIISNEQYPRELHVTQNEQQVDKQSDRDLVIGTEYQDDRYENLDDQNYIRKPRIEEL